LGVRGEVEPCTKIPVDKKLLLKESYDKKQSDNDAYMSELNDNEEKDSVVEGIFRKEKDLQMELPRERVMLKVWWMHLCFKIHKYLIRRRRQWLE